MEHHTRKLRHYNSLRRSASVSNEIRKGLTRSKKSFIEAKHAKANIRIHVDETGKKHIVYLTTKPVTYFSYEYPPVTLHEYYDEYNFQPLDDHDLLNDPSLLKNNNNSMRTSGRSTPDPNQSAGKRRSNKHLRF